MLSLQKIMGEAEVLDFQKICERITPAISFREQAAWWISEIKAGRIVHAKKRTQIRAATIIGYETAVSYLNAQIGDMALASVDNPEAKSLIAKMRLAVQDARPRFGDKTIVEYFSVLQKIIKSAVDDKLRQLYPRTWDLSAICLPKVNPKNQHRPTLEIKGQVSGSLCAIAGDRSPHLRSIEPGDKTRVKRLLDYHRQAATRQEWTSGSLPEN
jgi:hypothetical protein